MAWCGMIAILLCSCRGTNVRGSVFACEIIWKLYADRLYHSTHTDTNFRGSLCALNMPRCFLLDLTTQQQRFSRHWSYTACNKSPIPPINSLVHFSRPAIYVTIIIWVNCAFDLPFIGKIRMVKVKIRAWTHPQDELGRMRIWHMAELHDSRH